ncbi:hypothetical protein JS518_14055 [Clostridiales bacterium FE2010]|nr:hypothetical protein JS518_14055 [Clostridiales bacterium FE2010]
MYLNYMRSFTICDVEFQLLNDKKHLIVRRTPNDSLDKTYRWAIKTDSGWKVYLEKEYQMSVGGVFERITPEDVARKMYVADSNEN